MNKQKLQESIIKDPAKTSDDLTKSSMPDPSVLRNGILGLAVGDALGVPYETCSLAEMKAAPCSGMIGYKKHGQPAGTWSDDTSMSLCIADSLCSGFDPDSIMKRFLRWQIFGEYTASGIVFDIGSQTRRALSKYKDGIPAEYCGDCSVSGNGNAGLMRTFPIACYQCFVCSSGDDHLQSFLEPIHEVSGLTHAHEIGLICCGLFSLLLREWLFSPLDSRTIRKAAESAFKKAEIVYTEMGGAFSAYIRDRALFLPPEELSAKKAEDLPSWGYVLNTWNIALWSLLTTDNYRDCVLKAVNVGGDTDTAAAVAGALAGAFYGLGSIPEEWILALKNRELLERICSRLERKLFGPQSTGPIENFQGEYGFLSMKAPSAIRMDGLLYSNLASLFYALRVPPEYRASFTQATAKQARKQFRSLPHTDESSTALTKKLYTAVKARYEQNPKDLQRLLATGSRPIVYNTSGSHDNRLGRCRCEACIGKSFENLYGKVLMQVREELRLACTAQSGRGF